MEPGCIIIWGITLQGPTVCPWNVYPVLAYAKDNSMKCNLQQCLGQESSISGIGTRFGCSGIQHGPQYSWKPTMTYFKVVHLMDSHFCHKKFLSLFPLLHCMNPNLVQSFFHVSELLTPCRYRGLYLCLWLKHFVSLLYFVSWFVVH